MTKIKSIFEDYLSENKILKLEKLGSENKANEISESSNITLKSKILKQSNFNNIIVIVSIVLLCIIFSLGIFFAILYRNDPTTIGVIFGGTFFSLLVIVSRLRKIWLEKSIMDISINIIDDLSPQEASKFIQTIYFNMAGKEDKNKNAL